MKSCAGWPCSGPLSGNQGRQVRPLPDASHPERPFGSPGGREGRRWCQRVRCAIKHSVKDRTCDRMAGRRESLRKTSGRCLGSREEERPPALTPGLTLPTVGSQAGGHLLRGAALTSYFANRRLGPAGSGTWLLPCSWAAKAGPPGQARLSPGTGLPAAGVEPGGEKRLLLPADPPHICTQRQRLSLGL